MSGSYPAITKSLFIKASAPAVWHALTDPVQLKKWMLDDEMEMDFFTDWKEGSPLIITGKLHAIAFENKGFVLKSEAGKTLHYTHLSSLSQLEDKLENYSSLLFELNEIDYQTELRLRITNFPTYEIYKHLQFYWLSALEIMKKQLEENNKA